jgi:hypothetical protein
MQLYKLELFGHLGHQDFTATTSDKITAISPKFGVKSPLFKTRYLSQISGNYLN